MRIGKKRSEENEKMLQEALERCRVLEERLKRLAECSEDRAKCLEKRLGDVSKDLNERISISEARIIEFAESVDSRIGDCLRMISGMVKKTEEIEKRVLERGKDTECRFAEHREREERIFAEIRDLRTLRESLLEESFREKTARDILDEYLNGERSN